MKRLSCASNAATRGLCSHPGFVPWIPLNRSETTRRLHHTRRPLGRTVRLSQIISRRVDCMRLILNPQRTLGKTR